ncbi:O-antigen ligase family protein [Macrococcoides bohemicum]|uniref:Capsular biosynthesis protein n=1 Tax=Macrococcoides bohemicum TaxID=1903056 RepID=A0A328A3X7_9STAP|nr:O-antigen ligase family protein [Macrococcus bohemicus]RAK49221.1 capsular biosynthesis protein [Macrococcus bohemicus]
MKHILFISIFTLNIFILCSAFVLQNFNQDILFIYYPFCIVFAILNYICFIILTLKYFKLKRTFIYLLLFSLLLIISFVISDFNNTDIVKINFYLFFVWSVPAAIAGIYFSDIDRKEFEKLIKKLYFFNSLLITLTILIPYLLSKLEKPINLGLMNYQNITYITAFTIGLGLYFIISDSYKRNVIYIIMNLILLPVIFIGAGRGGTLVLIVYVLITLLNIFKNRNIKFIYKLFTGIFTLVMCFLFYQLSAILDKDNRIFAYITSDGINLDEGASGRNIVYEMDIDAISNSPLLGYGFFNYYQLTYSVPHNLFLEILLIGGFLLGFIFILFMIYFVFKIYVNYSDEYPDKLVLYICVYPLLLLMFSTNFLIVSEFWFFIFYFISRLKNGRLYNKSV